MASAGGEEKNNSESGYSKVGEASITFSDDLHGSITLPVLKGSIGNPVIDIRPLFQSTKFSVFDPGFTSTASCHSEITYIDGPEGVLLHRGYPIEELAEHSDFLDVSYLLLFGDLPNPLQREQHERSIRYHTMVHEQLIRFFAGFKSNAHPMAIMVGVVGALSAFYHDSLDIRSPRQRMYSAYRLIAKMPTIAAIAYKTSAGQPIVYPDNTRSYAENFLYMLFSTPCEEYKVNPVFAQVMDKIFLLHADHEQNASTTTVRIAGSSLANPFACIAAGIASLWGPAHGGANEAVLKMLTQIGKKENIPLFIAKAKDKKDPFRLWGFGHRVYKQYDPRARIMRKMCTKVLDELREGRAHHYHDRFVDDDGDLSPIDLLELAQALEEEALADEYFQKRKLFPNVDFYTGIVMKAIGIPTSMFTVIFAMARTVGWIANFNEMVDDPVQKISRPRQLYCGSPKRQYIPLELRPIAGSDRPHMKSNL